MCLNKEGRKWIFPPSPKMHTSKIATTSWRSIRKAYSNDFLPFIQIYTNQLLVHTWEMWKETWIHSIASFKAPRKQQQGDECDIYLFLSYLLFSLNLNGFQHAHAGSAERGREADNKFECVCVPIFGQVDSSIKYINIRRSVCKSGIKSVNTRNIFCMRALNCA